MFGVEVADATEEVDVKRPEVWFDLKCGNPEVDYSAMGHNVTSREM